MSRPFVLYVLCFLHLLTGLSALGGGMMLAIRPDGSLLGLDKDWLALSPFPSYLLPGVFLALFLGIFPLFTAFGLLSKPGWSWPNALNPYTDRHWSWAFSIFTGIIIISWIAIQITMIPYFWLQPALIFVGLLILTGSLLPSIMNYLSGDDNGKTKSA
jgi:hypothetical protein